MPSAMCARVHIFKTLQPAGHDLLLFVGGFLWVVGSEGVQKGPWVLAEFLSIEGTGMVGFGIMEIGSESAKWAFLADGFVTILLVLVEHGLSSVVVIKCAKKYNCVLQS